MNPYHSYPGIRINGIFYSKKELNDRKEGNSQYENQILEFARELFDDHLEISFLTSGSTGTPKEIRFSKEAVHLSAAQTNSYFELNEKDALLLSLPLSFIAGKLMVCRAVQADLDIIAMEPSSHPLKEKVDFDFAAFTPHQFFNILREQKENLPEEASILLGGGPVSNDLQKEIELVINPVFLGFGMTETLTHFALKNLKSKGSEFELLDGSEIKSDSEGRLSINRKGITEDWITTNDIVAISKTGFTWKGRFDNVINTGGIKLYPEELESLLQEHISSPFFLAGIPDAELGSKLVLFIEDSKMPNLEDVKFKSAYGKPKEVILLNTFKRTESGKIRRQLTVSDYLGS